ncbi:MAG: long-chain acyl-CoA synthetase [Candidatus Marinimicrobia bacterium]|nr:long-chain acyl-CoA synthetase [Candidatus Neomarinimicrobiota bacterium]
MMVFNTISEMFYGVVDKYKDKVLYLYKNKDEWIGLKGSVIHSTVEEIAFGLKSISNTSFNSAILSTNSPRWAMADYGIICSGGCTVSIYPTLIPSQIEYILNDSETKVLFVENKNQLEKVLEIKHNCESLEKIIVMDDSYNDSEEYILNFMDFLNSGNEYSKKSDLSFKDLVDLPNENDLLTLIYTSGTTGNPKGVMLTHKNLVSNINSTIDGIRDSDGEIFVEKDRLLSFLPLSHVFERMCGHFCAFSQGAQTYYAENMEKIVENMIEVKPSLMISVPRLYEKMYTKVIDKVKAGPPIRQKIFWWGIGVGKKIVDLKTNNEEIPWLLQKKFDLADKIVFSKIKARVGGNLRYFFSGGAPLSKKIGEFFGAAGITILEGYGLTETSPILSANLPGKMRYGTVGKIWKDVEIKIADDGEIIAKGPNIMKGYYNNEEATKEVIDSEGWFLTGDIGELSEDGFLKITDRKKNIIITSQGKNVAPAAMENALVTSQYIEQIVTIGDKESFISALIVPSFENLEIYLNNKGVKLSTNQDMINHKDVVELIEKVVNDEMKNFSKFERIKKFKLLPDLLTIEKGELTPTLKVVRRVVLKNYKEYINQIYDHAETLSE